MKIATIMIVVIVVLASVGTSCGGSDAQWVQPSEVILEGVLVNTLNGKSDVTVDKPFIFQFDHPVDEQSVRYDAFHVRRTPQRDPAASVTDFDATVCRLAWQNYEKVYAEQPVCDDDRCMIQLKGSLKPGVAYTVCLMPSITYQLSEESFNGFMATFITQSQPVSFEVTLVDGDDKAIERTRGVPLRTRVQYDVERSLKYTFYFDYDYDERAIFEKAVMLVDEDGSEVEGVFEWSESDSHVVTFVSSKPLKKATTYAVLVDRAALPGTEMGKGIGGELENVFEFTTRIDGDVDGDGYADVLVGAPGRGYAQLIYGSGFALVLDGDGPAVDSENKIYWDGGSTVAHIGDIDADGFADIAIGDPDYNMFVGRVTVYLGGGDRYDIYHQDVHATYGGSDATGFGEKVSAAGDFNGDGYDDFMATFGKGTEQCVGLYLNGRYGVVRDTTSTSSSICTDESDVLWFGNALAGGGDFNGDGYADIAIGVESIDNDRIYIYFGQESLDSYMNEENADVIITRASGPLGFVSSLAIAGDVDGDGLDDLLIGSDIGGAYVITGSQLVDDVDASEAFAMIEGAAGGDQFGHTVAGGGDLDGDGLDDIVVGHWGYPDFSFDSQGRAYVFFGSRVKGTLSSDDADVVITGADAIDQLGSSMIGGFDINGDGRDDLLVGALQNPDGTGRLYVFTGADEMSDCDLGAGCVAWSTLEGGMVGDIFGIVQ